MTVSAAEVDMHWRLTVSADESSTGQLVPATIAEAAALLDREGFVVLDGALPVSDLGRCRHAALESLAVCSQQARTIGLDPIPTGTSQGFAEIVHRAPGRFDMLHGADRPVFTGPLFGERAVWMPIVRAALGPKAQRLYRGILIARGQAAEQPWHADGEHLFPGSGRHLPPHCLNVFVPLVDVGAENGPTEFCPGSHRLSGGLAELYQQDTGLLERIGFSGPTAIPRLPVGSVLLFDYRLVHRGRQNHTDADRPVLYLTFATPWFRDVRSFPERRLFAGQAPDGGPEVKLGR
jgi:hypothetical protein